MSARRKRAGKRPPARPKKNPSKTRSPAASPRRISPALAGAQEALEECIGAICLVEVTLHSLESQEIATPEQEVLKRALKTIWCVHDWMGELRLNDLARAGADSKEES
jgi:hypothetical protein